ncbi:MAG: response regulator [Bacteroidetes bacterium]|nr:response regulator [Bacteroidota bacterium]
MNKVILIDDEPLARQLIAAFLEEHKDFEVVAACSDGFEGVKAIQELQPDLIFLDVQMPRLSGFEMLELIDNPPGVIFTTAFDQYALDAFEAQAIDYLLKPIKRERFNAALEKWKVQKPKFSTTTMMPALSEGLSAGYSQRIVLKDRGAIRIIPAKDIHYIEASDDYIKVVCNEGTFLKKQTMATLEKSLDPQQFVRVHRSWIVPVSQIGKIEPYEKESHIAKLQCGAKVLISKSGMAKLKIVLGW